MHSRRKASMFLSENKTVKTWTVIDIDHTIFSVLRTANPVGNQESAGEAPQKILAIHNISAYNQKIVFV